MVAICSELHAPSRFIADITSWLHDKKRSLFYNGGVQSALRENGVRLG